MNVDPETDKLFYLQKSEKDMLKSNLATAAGVAVDLTFRFVVVVVWALFWFILEWRRY